MGVLFFILFFAVLLFISIKLGNLKQRAKQHVLKNSGLSTSDFSAGIASSFEKKHLEKFLSEFPSFTEESLKDLLKQYSVQLFNRNEMNEFSQNVNEKMQKDSKLDKMQTMEFRRTTISYYAASKLNATVVYTDNRDEYELFLGCTMVDNQIQVDSYRISKGAIVGF